MGLLDFTKITKKEAERWKNKGIRTSKYKKTLCKRYKCTKCARMTLFKMIYCDLCGTKMQHDM